MLAGARAPPGTARPAFTSPSRWCGRHRRPPAGGAFPRDAFFCPEVSLSREVELDLTPKTEVWKFPVATVSRSERGFEETVQGYSYTPRWPARAGEAGLTVRVRPSA